TVEIASLKYIPFRSFSIKGIAVYSDKDKQDRVFFAHKLAIAVDLMALIKDKRLVTDINVEDLSTRNLLYETTGRFRTFSRKAPSYRDVLDPSLLDLITIIKAKTSIKQTGKIGDDYGEDISGIIKLDKMVLSEVDIQLTYNDVLYFFTLNKGPSEGAAQKYELKISSEEVDAECDLETRGKDLFIRDLKGEVYRQDISLTGEIKNFTDPSNARYFVNGDLETFLENMVFLREKPHLTASLPGRFKMFSAPAAKAGNIIGKYGISGHVTTKFQVKGKGLKLRSYYAAADISAEDIKVGDLLIKNVNGAVNANNTQIYLSGMKGSLCGGRLNMDLKMELFRADLPYSLKLELKGLDLSGMPRDTKSGGSIAGICDIELLLSGKAVSPEMTAGRGGIRIREADLDTVPVIRSFLEGTGVSVMEQPGGTRIKAGIDQLRADFMVGNGRLTTGNLIASGDGIYAAAKGYVGFDGVLSLKCTSRVRRSSAIEEGSWEGERVDISYLHGTLSDPKWESGQ
ncbi:MAG: hypothetical protein ABIA77_02305, partial [Candidatus Omnitrophota bacterium]